MILYLARTGQMCNQLISLSMIYALGKEFKQDVICPVIDPILKEYFEFGNENDVTKVRMFSSPVWELAKDVVKIYRRISKRTDQKRYDPSKPNKVIQVFTSRIAFLDEKIYINHLDEIRKYFALKKEIVSHCRSLINQIEEDGATVIGVHIRRGDYKDFLNGKWYYDDNIYLHWMQEISKKQKTKFVICSNEKVDLKYYEKHDLEVYSLGKNSIEDICLLSLCDYVMGPPSTYSLWAALLGNKKRLILEDRNAEYSMNDFKTLEVRIMDGEEMR